MLFNFPLWYSFPNSFWQCRYTHKCSVLVCDPLFLSSAPNEDYRPVNTIVEFGSSESERCVYVRMINDTQVEQSESFDISLTPTTNLDDRIILVQDSAKVIIRNDDGKLISDNFSFCFLSSTYTSLALAFMIHCVVPHSLV